MERQSTSIRMTADGKRLLELLAKHLGISQSAVLELSIRAYAASHGVSDKPDVKEQPPDEQS
jgi:hypothetical protein